MGRRSPVTRLARLAVAVVTFAASLAVVVTLAPTASATSATHVYSLTDRTCIVTSSHAILSWGPLRGGTPWSGCKDLPFENGPSLGAYSGTLLLGIGADHTCWATHDTITCLGKNESGQLGTGTTAPSPNWPRPPVSGLDGHPASMDAGLKFTCVLLTSGGVQCWGSNALGQIGDGTSNPAALTPQDVQGLAAGVVDIGVGTDSACAVLNTGGVRCWGDNTFGQLGNGTTEGSSTPVDVLQVAGATQVTVGDRFACATIADGTAKCWGSNAKGNLGDGSVLDRTVPVLVSGLTDVRSMAAGHGSTCAITDAGGVQCWGQNTYGQLGNGTAKRSRIPTQVIGLTHGVAEVSPDRNHTCAATVEGAVLCWGKNGWHQLGDGTDTDRLTPVAVLGVAGGNDTQGPVVTITVTTDSGGGPDGLDGWFISAPQVSIVSDDTTTGGSVIVSYPASCTPNPPHRHNLFVGKVNNLVRKSWSIVMPTDGVFDSTCTATDMEGNTGTGTLHVKRDHVAPKLTLPGRRVFELNETAEAMPVASDATSGLAGPPSCGPLDTSSVGTKTVECTASDVAGNTKVKSFTYRVE
jgi:alpha-tubulin suppressor-like RCC1 family protein